MGETLGPYYLDKRIGAGGMADVFLARGPRGVCVIKRPHPHLCASPDFVRMFLDEASILASLHHPNIAEIFDLGQVNGVFYRAMEYVPGFDLMTISLEHERQGELMAPELCARIVADVAGALHSAHEARHPKTGQPLSLIHRDVSPHNVLLSTTGVVKLIDFGVARAATATHRTQAGLVKGKYPYMAPEQITGQDIDRRVDIYALGLVLYELLTNVRAIAGNAEVEQIDNARASRIRPIEQLRPNLPMPIRQILASCVHPDRDGRYPTALALKEDLEKYLRYVGQPIGQEDLLRLFRVVAAEVAHLEPGTPPHLDAAAAQNTWAGARTEQEIPSDPAALPGDDQALGVAPTAPSMRVTAIPGEPTPLPVPSGVKATGPQPAPDLKLTPFPSLGQDPPDLRPTNPSSPVPVVSNLPKEMQATGIIGDRKKLVKEALEGSIETIPARPAGPGVGRWVLLALLAAGVVAVGVRVVSGRAASEAADAGVTGPVLVAVVDAGSSEVSETTVDAGLIADLSHVFVDAGQPGDDRASVVEVTSNLTMEITSGGHSFGFTSPKGPPVRLELPPGKHLIEAKNTSMFCFKSAEVDLAPGDTERLKVVNATGWLDLRVQPGGLFFINGRKMNPQVTMVKDVLLCEGQYDVNVKFDGHSKSMTAKVSAGNRTPVDFGLISEP
jgi:serine/threonine-protein kinase